MIKKRGNSWWVVVYTGRDPLTGKKRQKTGTARTRAEARQLEALTEDFLEDTRAYDIEDVMIWPTTDYITQSEPRGYAA